MENVYIKFHGALFEARHNGAVAVRIDSTPACGFFHDLSNFMDIRLEDSLQDGRDLLLERCVFTDGKRKYRRLHHYSFSVYVQKEFVQLFPFDSRFISAGENHPIIVADYNGVIIGIIMPIRVDYPHLMRRMNTWKYETVIRAEKGEEFHDTEILPKTKAKERLKEYLTRYPDYDITWFEVNSGEIFFEKIAKPY